MTLPTEKQILIQCHDCKQHAVIETKTNHYCSKECSQRTLKAYWRNIWLKRKTDPVAMAHVRRAKKRYYQKSKLTE